jgi:hypothetical protein
MTTENTIPQTAGKVKPKVGTIDWEINRAHETIEYVQERLANWIADRQADADAEITRLTYIMAERKAQAAPDRDITRIIEDIQYIKDRIADRQADADAEVTRMTYYIAELEALREAEAKAAADKVQAGKPEITEPRKVTLSKPAQNTGKVKSEEK